LNFLGIAKHDVEPVACHIPGVEGLGDLSQVPQVKPFLIQVPPRTAIDRQILLRHRVKILETAERNAVPIDSPAL
jgi:hypothetical protein